MKLITEEISDVKFITEGKGSKKKMYIEGVFLQGDLKNRNGRMYPVNTLAKEVNRYNEAFVAKGRALGELGHPDGPGINLERVSHMITELKEDGNNVVGRAKIIDTPYGKIVQNLISNGAQLGVSSRGMGSLEEKGGVKYVKDDFYLATAADIVADPSAPEAFVQGVMEGKEWVWESGILKEKVLSAIKKEITGASYKKLENAKIKAFNSFLSNL